MCVELLHDCIGGVTVVRGEHQWTSGLCITADVNWKETHIPFNLHASRKHCVLFSVSFLRESCTQIFTYKHKEIQTYMQFMLHLEVITLNNTAWVEGQKIGQGHSFFVVFS